MKQIPNIFTLLNLVFGCMAIMYAVQPGLVPQVSEGEGGLVQVVNIPEQIQMASVFIGIAALVDFLDGFVARLLKATSPMGKQLDSLSDVVSFGVAPGMIMLQLLRLAYAQQPDGLDVNVIWLAPAFIIPAAGAYRLARFNLDHEQSQAFKGVPTPAVALLIASFPLIDFIGSGGIAQSLGTGFVYLLLNKWFLYAVIIVASWLMVSKLPMMALKFTSFSIKNNWPQFALIAVSVVAALVLQWLAAPLVFVLYVVLSLLTKQKNA